MQVGKYKSLAKKKEFFEYVFAFYGKGGIYDLDVTAEDIREAIAIRMQDDSADFCGDTLDREKVRYILDCSKEAAIEICCKVAQKNWLYS